MGRIKKAAGPKHEATMPLILSDFVSTATKLPIAKLSSHLRSFQSKWPFPRGDLYHWIPVLDHFDKILEQFVKEYGLTRGPQTQKFGSRILQGGLTEAKSDGEQETSVEELNGHGYGDEGDRELIETMLTFSRMLLENCGNRSLYSSSDRLGDLLNTTSLSLLSATLRLATCLASRYHYSRSRSGMNRDLNPGMLASHYNMNLDYVQKLADSFAKFGPIYGAQLPSSGGKSNLKGKEITSSNVPSNQKVINGNDLFAIATSRVTAKSNDSPGARGTVHFTYYKRYASPEGDAQDARDSQNGTIPPALASPTSARRSSGLSRVQRVPTSEASSSSHTGSVARSEKPQDSLLQTIDLSYSELLSVPLENLLQSRLPEMPKAVHYEFLHRLRVARAVNESLDTRRQILAIRILAITNLAYIYPEHQFQQKLLQQDSDEPRHLHIVEQLRKLVLNIENGADGIPLELKTIAVKALEGFTKHKSRYAEVCSALGVNVSHGTLLHLLRQLVTDLGSDDPNGDSTEADEWRDVLLFLLDSVASSASSPASKTAESLVSAGLFDILIDILKLRTSKAERIHPGFLVFINNITHSVRDAYQTFASAKGLDAVADLVLWEVMSSIEKVRAGEGIPESHRSQVMDYRMPFFQQQALRSLFKFVNHMMQYNNANVDRLLRNLIDSPPLLKGLLQVITNGKLFGSTIWSGAVQIVSSFIHNEPTSYAIVAEAGLSTGLLEAVSQKSVDSPKDQSDLGNQPSLLVIKKTTSDAISIITRPSAQSDSKRIEDVSLTRDKSELLAQGILPASDAIVNIPQAFGAICLNQTGMQLFLQSSALNAFFEIFESPDHVKALTSSSDFPKILGSSFDELVRHHPKLKTSVMQSVITMIARLGHLCRTRDWGNADELKLWTFPDDGEPVFSGEDNGVDENGTNSQQNSPGDPDISMAEASNTKDVGGTTSKEPSKSEYVAVVMKFLAGFCENQSLCSSLIQEGGVDFILDLATSSNLPHHFNSSPEAQELCRVMHMLVEQKPHLVLPPILKRTQETLNVLEPLLAHDDKTAFFAPFYRRTNPISKDASPMTPVNGLAIMKALVNAHTLCNILTETFSHSLYGSRSNHSLYSQVNLADLYVLLVVDLGRLYRACVWEEILLQNSIPASLRESTKIDGLEIGNGEGNAETPSGENTVPIGNINNGVSGHSNGFEVTNGYSVDPQSADGVSNEASLQSKNLKLLKYLLSQLPSSITPFFSGLGRALMTKRKLDSYLRQNAYMVAEALGRVVLEHLKYERAEKSGEPKDRFAYWIVILNSISQLMVEGTPDRPQNQCLTIILQAFKKQEGFSLTNDLLGLFFDEAKSKADSEVGLYSCALLGMKIILSFYASITNSKSISESISTQGMVTERDRGNAYYFNPSQCLIELRHSVLSAVKKIWDSGLMEKQSRSIAKCLIDILRTILEAEGEQSAFKKHDVIPARGKPEFKPYSISTERESHLKHKDIPADLAKEALYRCLNSREAAEEYCNAHLRDLNIPRLPLPDYDQEKKTVPTPPPPSSEPRTPEAPTDGSEAPSQSQEVPEMSASGGMVLEPPTTGDDQNEAELQENVGALPMPASVSEDQAWTPAPDADGEGVAMSIENLLNLTDQVLHPPNGSAEMESTPARETPVPAETREPETPQPLHTIRVTDLDEARDSLRKNLIDHVLDMLSAHEDITFDLSDLIVTAAAKATDANTMRREIGETLVQSLISFQMEDDFRPAGKKIASYANLLAILIQQRAFYEATFDELKSNFSLLIGFVKIFPDQPSEEASPWVGQVLLVLEKLLAEDVQPQQIRWTPPDQDWAEPEDVMAEMEESLVPTEDKMFLFEAIAEILPRVGKDPSLALSAVRVLVILTREREIANALGDKRNLQRLFVMAKQLAGISDERFQRTFMLVLRHIIEDDDTIREVMRSDIVSYFQGHRNRSPDTASYVRHMAHLVLRSPPLFLEITNEKLKLARFDPNQRPQVLILKPSKDDTSNNDSENNAAGQSNAEPESPHDKGQATIQPTTEGSATGEAIDERSKAVEVKTPVVERPDGVIHYLLSQLLSLREVVDTDGDVPKEASESGALSSADPGAAAAADQPSTSARPAVATDKEEDRKVNKVEYHPERHPIYNYRCFLLQCLTELLMSYGRAKIEFINFSPKVDPKAMTSSKPRSLTLNYLLNTLIPIGTLERPDSLASKKKDGLSKWAMCVVVGLCLKPDLQSITRKDEDADEGPDPDLLFVRKFVLESALRAFKDAQSSSEHLDIKYARLRSLADLFGRLLVSHVLPSKIPARSSNNERIPTLKEVARIMFEKNYISTLTNSISDIDLNFPNATRAVKKILGPLKALSETAIYLSQNSDIASAPTQTEDGEISTASSVSEGNDEREETPDLFRNSTLGLLDPGRQEDMSSETSDEDDEMYDGDEYDEGMDYEDEVEHDDDEVVSDEDEEIGDAGPVEGLSGDVGMDVEVVIDGEDDPTDEDSDESDDMDDDDDDDVEVIDNITPQADDENDELDDAHDDEWQDEEDPGDDYAEELDQDEGQMQDQQDDADEVAVVRDLVRDLQDAGAEPPPGAFDELAMGADNDRFMTDFDFVRDEDDVDEDEDEDDLEDDGVTYEPDYEDDEVEPEPPALWGWDTEDEPAPAPRDGHHHTHTRRIASSWNAMFPGPDRGMIVPTDLIRRPNTIHRGFDDGQNPLLQRPTANPQPRRGIPSHDAVGSLAADWMQMIHSRRRGGFESGAVSMINSMMSAIGAGGIFGGGPASLHLHIGGGGPGGFFPRPPDVEPYFSRSQVDYTRPSREDTSFVPQFTPKKTTNRWSEEGQLLFGKYSADRTQRIINALLKLLVPGALEEERIRKEKEAEAAEARRKKEEEERAREEERLAKEKAEKEAQEQKEKEEREAAERAAAEQSREGQVEHDHGDDAMEGVEETGHSAETAVVGTADASQQATESGPSNEPERVLATFRGREVDITGLGIDLDYLNALPDELREEVLMQQFAEQRSQAAVSGEAPTEISREFLDALPTDIREEILQQEAQDRRRREREEARQQAAANGTAPAARAEDMDPASFLASLDPVLRNAVLMDQGDDVLSQLPPSIAAEARALPGMRDRWGDHPRLQRSNAQRLRREEPAEQAVKRPRKQIVQMLDKAGVATLLRLLFIPQAGDSETLHKILENISQNKQSRAEVLGLLLSILQDGSADIHAIERSFVHLSVRAKQPSQKSQQGSKQSSPGSTTSPLNADMTPLMVIQQCLSAMVYLTDHNMHVPTFFLTEHDSFMGLKGKSAKKGKAKESPASKYALNVLLSLLDRKMIMESAGCMEQLSTLLQIITHPLIILQKKEKAKSAEDAAKAESTEQAPASDVMQTEPGRNGEREGNDTSSAPIEGTIPDTTAPQPPASSSEPQSSPIAEKSESAKKAEEERTGKQKKLAPPVVPEHNLRLVVNILAARECSSKTFRDTVSTINNLSGIPGAKEIFGKELIKQAQDLGDTISRDLDELIPHIQEAGTATDAQGVALAKFQPSSSDQAKLLRVLTALDYLFDPRRKAAKLQTEASDSNVEQPKDDMLASLYEHSTFGPLWSKLSECLGCLRQRDNTTALNIATILLPLIEALMVVCKNTAAEDAPTAKTTKDFAVTSPAPEPIMENLFFRFTEDHRKILNDLVRHNPRLMSGTFSLLVKNPKVLEFDNKRNYFTRRLHSRTEPRHPQPPLQLSVRRDQVFIDSYRSLYFKSPDEMKYGKLSIRFHGEEGVDAGGVSREWFQAMSRQMFNPDYALFIPVASDRTTFHPNKLSQVNGDHLMFFKFIGRVIGKALYEGRALDCHFSRAVYKKILGKPVSIKDMETLDLDYYKSLLWMLENDISDIITETFSVEIENFGDTKIIDLIENGRNIPVTEENKHEYVQLVVEDRLTGSVKEQLEEFLKGFHDIVPAELISIFNEQELELLISGLPDIDIDDWKNNTEYHNYSASSSQIQWLWRAVRSFDKEERAKLLQFVTGTSKVPLNGFKELEGMNGFSRFNIHRDYGNKDRLPSSHTCFNQLDLPEYETYEALRQQLYTAMTAGSEYFGFA